MHLHGSLHSPRCFACVRPHVFDSTIAPEINEEKIIEPPRCCHCDGKIRPQAEGVAGKCDVMLVIGTSGLVYPVAKIPSITIHNKAITVQINPTSTDFDSSVTYNLVGKAGEILPTILEQL